jgi:ABC-type multidrug transport system fused ATPase/permease subunit
MRIRKKYFRSTMLQSFSLYDEEKTGELTSRVASDVDLIQDGIGDKVGSAAQFLSTGVVEIIISFVHSWKLTLVILAIAPVLAAFGAVFAKLTADTTGEGQDAYGAAGAVENEALALIRTVHAFGGQEEEAKRYEERLNSAYKSNVRKGFVSGMGMGMTVFLLFCTYSLCFWYGAKLNREATSTRKTCSSPSSARSWARWASDRPRRPSRRSASPAAPRHAFTKLSKASRRLTHSLLMVLYRRARCAGRSPSTMSLSTTRAGRAKAPSRYFGC